MQKRQVDSNWSTLATVGGAALWVVLLSVNSLAQGSCTLAGSQGNNAVGSTCTGSTKITGSAAYVDASAGFAGANICDIINKILVSKAQAVVVDARGVLNTAIMPAMLNCTTGTITYSPFDNVTVGSTVLLPAGNIKIPRTWVLPKDTRLIGSINVASSVNQTSTSIQPDSTFMANAPSGSTCALIQMCGSTTQGCGTYTSACTGISIEHLQINGGGLGVHGIQNVGAQDQSFVNDVVLMSIKEIGLLVSPSATNALSFSGPYTNLNITTAAAADGQNTACVSLQAQTLGLHGISCISSDSTLTAAGTGAILVQASNNSIEDIHTEGFWDGIEIGDLSSAAAPVQNVLVSNITSASGSPGQPRNTVHICGTNTDSGLGACRATGSNVSDVVVRQATMEAGDVATPTAAVRDDVTGTSLKPLTMGSQWTAAMYALGEAVGGSTTSRPQYSGFSLAPSIVNWSFGGGAITSGTTCSSPGALFSNKTGHAGSTIYVCTGGGTWLYLF